MALGVFVIANDFTALSVAIPNIEHDLSTSLTKVKWVVLVFIGRPAAVEGHPRALRGRHRAHA